MLERKEICSWSSSCYLSFAYFWDKIQREVRPTVSFLAYFSVFNSLEIKANPLCKLILGHHLRTNFTFLSYSSYPLLIFRPSNQLFHFQVFLQIPFWDFQLWHHKREDFDWVSLVGFWRFWRSLILGDSVHGLGWKYERRVDFVLSYGCGDSVAKLNLGLPVFLAWQVFEFLPLWTLTRHEAILMSFGICDMERLWLLIYWMQYLWSNSFICFDFKN